MSNLNKSLTPDQIKVLVSQTLKTKGWEIIEEIIEEEIEQAREKLPNIDPLDFTKITRYQQKIKVLTGLKNKINNLTK